MQPTWAGKGFGQKVLRAGMVKYFVENKQYGSIMISTTVHSALVFSEHPTNCSELDKVISMKAIPFRHLSSS